MQDLLLFIDYIEGRESASDFRDILACDDILENKIRRAYAAEISSPDYNVNTLIARLNFAKKEDRDNLDDIVETILTHFGQTYNKPKNANVELSVSDVLLPFLADDVSAEKYVFEKIFQQMPQGLTRAGQKRFCKARQNEEFRYEVSPPKWMQGGEWPYDEAGRPLVFKKSYEDGLHCVVYVFNDCLNKNTVEIKQYD